MYQYINLFGCWVAMSTNFGRLGQHQMSYELIHRLLFGLRVIRRQKMSVLAPLHLVIELSFE